MKRDAVARQVVLWRQFGRGPPRVAASSRWSRLRDLPSVTLRVRFGDFLLVLRRRRTGTDRFELGRYGRAVEYRDTRQQTPEKQRYHTRQGAVRRPERRTR